MSSLVIGPIKERLNFLIQSAELIANVTQELICPATGYIDGFDLIVQKAITTGGTVTLNGGGAIYDLQSYLDVQGAPMGDHPYLPGVSVQTAQLWTASAATNPGYVNLNGHGFVPGQAVVLGGTVPTGFTSGSTYYVSANGWDANHFNLSTTIANALSGVNITGSGSNSTTATFTAGAQGVIPITNCALAVASAAAVGTEYKASVPVGDPTNLVVAGQVLTVSLASFATAGELNGTIRIRSSR